MTDENRTLLAEIGDLAVSIGLVVKQFQRLNDPLVDSQQKVPIATEQLDRVATQTEAATNRMLDMAESILGREEGLIRELQEIKRLAEGGRTHDIVNLSNRMVTRANRTLDEIYEMIEAMQFQDITAQRIGQAAELLGEVEQRLTKIESAVTGSLAPQDGRPAIEERPSVAARGEGDLADQDDLQAVVDDLVSQQTARGK